MEYGKQVIEGKGTGMEPERGSRGRGASGSPHRVPPAFLCPRLLGIYGSLNSGLTSTASLGLFLALPGWLIWLPESFAVSNLCLN